MLFAGDLALTFLAFVAFLFFIGFGPAVLLVPAFLRRNLYVFTPFIGYSLAAVVLHDLNAYLLPTKQITWLMLGLAALLNAYVVWSRRRVLPRPSKEDLLLFALAFVFFFVAVSPLLSYSYSTVIGTNGDWELYVARADYLRQYPFSRLAEAAPNPLRDLMREPLFTSGGWGFSYAASALGVVLDRSGLDLFAPMMASFYALGAVAAYLFARHVGKLSVRGAGVVAAVAGLNGVILWSTFFNYGTQIASVMLLPVALIAGTHLFEDFGDKKVFAFAAVLFAGLLLSFYVAFFLACASLAPLFLWSLRSAGRVRRVKTTIWFGLLSAALGIVGLLRPLSRAALLLEGPVLEGGGPRPVKEYLGLGHLYGSDVYLWPATPSLQDAFSVGGEWDAILAGVQLPLVLGLALLGLVTLLRGERRMVRPLASIVAAQGLGLVFFRFVLPNPYGYFKLVTFATFLAVTASVLGFQLVWRWALAQRTGSLRVLLQGALALFLLLAISGAAVSALRTVRYFWSAPQSGIDQDTLTLSEAASLVASQEAVLLTDDVSVQGPWMAAASYFLRENPLFGDVRTSSGEYVSLPTSTYSVDGVAFQGYRVPSYGLLASNEFPEAKGYSKEDLIWLNRSFALYERDEDSYHMEPQAGPLALTGAEFDVRWPDSLLASPSNDSEALWQMRLGLVVLGEAAVDVQSAGKEETFSLLPGLSVVVSAPWRSPASLTLRVEGNATVYLEWADVVRTIGANVGGSVEHRPAGVVSVRAEETQRGEFSVRAWLPREAAGPFWITISGEAPVDPTSRNRLASYALPAQGGEELRFSLQDLGIVNEVMHLDQGVILYYTIEDRASATGHLSYPRFMLAEVTQDGLAEVQSLRYPPYSYYRVSVLEQPLGAVISETEGGPSAAELVGYTVLDPRVRTGDEARVILYWRVTGGFSQSYGVFVHFVDAKGSLVGIADGIPVNGGYSTQKWKRGETVADLHIVRVPQGTSPGMYQFVVGMSAVEPLVISQRSGKREGTHVVLGKVRVLPRKFTEVQKTAGLVPLAVRFGDSVALRGYRVHKSTAGRGRELQVDLVWEAIQAPNAEYKVSVQALDNVGALLAQHDSAPSNGQSPTSTWLKREVILDSHSIPIASECGSPLFELNVIVYQATTTKRVQAFLADGSVAKEGVVNLRSFSVQGCR